jgi:hypothetical protein
MDGYLYLQAPNGLVEAESDDFSSESDSKISRALSKTGTYTIWATTKDKGATGDFGISLSRETQTASCNSRALECDDAATGSLGDASCSEGPQGPDFHAEKFTFIGVAGETLWLNANWDFDGYLFLNDPHGQVVAENDNDSGPSTSHVEHTLWESGTYTVWATSYQPGATGSYEVSLDCDRPAGPDLTVDAPVLGAQLLVPGQSLDLSAKLHNTGDQPADSTTLHYVLSSDSRIDGSDPE